MVIGELFPHCLPNLPKSIILDKPYISSIVTPMFCLVVADPFLILIVRLEYRTFEYMRVHKLIYSKCMTIPM
jgi:hypothetical protein